ncbi:hypothetical protein B2A_04749, partial [mine drainage metagenome]
DAFKSSDRGKDLSEEIHSMFADLKKSLESGDMDERRRKKDTFDGKMKELVERYGLYSDLHKPVEYIRNGLGS